MAKTEAQKKKDAEAKAAKAAAEAEEETADTAPEEEETDEAEEDEEDADDEAPQIEYDEEVKEKILVLKKAKVKLDGTESPELIDTYYQDVMVNTKDKQREAVVMDGVPNNLPPRVEVLVIGGKERQFPVWFKAEVKGGAALYNEFGQRVTSVASTPEEQSLISRQLSKVNAERRARALPSDFK